MLGLDRKEMKAAAVSAGMLKAVVVMLCTAGPEAEGGVVSQMWEGVARMTQLAKETTQSFLEGSVQIQPTTGAKISATHTQSLSVPTSLGMHSCSQAALMTTTCIS